MEGGVNWEKFAPKNDNKHQSHIAQEREKTVLYNRHKSFLESPSLVAWACNLSRGTKVMELWLNSAGRVRGGY